MNRDQTPADDRVCVAVAPPETAMDKLEAMARAICYGASCGAGMCAKPCRSAAACKHWRDHVRTAGDGNAAGEAWERRRLVAGNGAAA